MLKNEQQRTIGNYTFHPSAILGEGAFARVYRGLHRQTGQPVAIKVIEIRSIDCQLKARLLRNQLNCHKQLQHENVMVVLDHVQTQERLYIVSEICEQGNLFDYIQKQGKEHGNVGRFAQETAMAVLYQLVKAINYVHSKGILHRDIKSANVLLKNGNIKLADFGLAVNIQSTEVENFTVGSPLYMSPEAYYYRQYSTKSDVWAVGMVLYEMLMGWQPFLDKRYEDALQSIVSGKLAESLPEGLAPFMRLILGRIFVIDPKERADSQELLGYLKSYVQRAEKQLSMRDSNRQVTPNKTEQLRKAPSMKNQRFV